MPLSPLKIAPSHGDLNPHVIYMVPWAHQSRKRLDMNSDIMAKNTHKMVKIEAEDDKNG